MPRIVSQLATRLELLSSSMLDMIVVGPHRPVSQFRREPLVNGLYVVHAPHGAILLSGLMLDTDDDALQAARADRVDALGTGGFATTYRVVDLGTADLARQLGRIVFDLFGGAFPLSQDAPALPESDAENAAVAGEVTEAAPTFRKRSRPAKPAADAPTASEPSAADVVAGGVSPAAPKKRGRPAKKSTAEVAEDQPAAVASDVDGQPSAAAADEAGTRDTLSPSATIVVSGDAERKSPPQSPPAEPTDEEDEESDTGSQSTEPPLIMTKNQRREKRRRELAQIRGGES